MTQAEIARQLNVVPESVGLWESGRRRMELNRLPRIAEILQLPKKELCAKALFEFHPCFCAELLGPDPTPAEAA